LPLGALTDRIGRPATPCGVALLGAVATFIGPGYPLAIVTCAAAPLLALPFVLRSRAPVSSSHVDYEEQLTSIGAVPIGGAEA
jgi:hypothetical protein